MRRKTLSRSLDCLLYLSQYRTWRPLESYRTTSAGRSFPRCSLNVCTERPVNLASRLGVSAPRLFRGPPADRRPDYPVTDKAAIPDSVSHPCGLDLYFRRGIGNLLLTSSHDPTRRV
jgi:hypothetical protein